MDFSLLQQGARYAGLRDVLAFDAPWMYYSILLVDPILRFCWIPLVIFTHDLQRGTIVAFIVAFAEVTRRGMWTLFRVENEHCTNVGHLKASRIVPLPYKVIRKSGSTDYEERASAIELEYPLDFSEQRQTRTEATTPALEAGRQLGHSGGRPRKTGVLVSISRILAKAHKQDFQKRKRESEEVEGDVLHGSRRTEGIELALQEDEESDSDEHIGEVMEADEEDRRFSSETLTMEHGIMVSGLEGARERDM